MDWTLSLLSLLGGVVLLMFIGLPVALAFLVTNVVAAFVFMGGVAGVDQLARNSIASVITASDGASGFAQNASSARSGASSRRR